MTSSCRFCNRAINFPGRNLSLTEFVTWELEGHCRSDVEVAQGRRDGVPQRIATAAYERLFNVIFSECASSRVMLSGRRYFPRSSALSQVPSFIPRELFLRKARYSMGVGRIGAGEMSWSSNEPADQAMLDTLFRDEKTFVYVEVGIFPHDALSIHELLHVKMQAEEKNTVSKPGREKLEQVLWEAAARAFPPDGKKMPGVSKKKYRDAVRAALPANVAPPSDKTFQKYGL